MANILKDLELTEVSLVDVPANPLASVPLFKRHTGEDMTEKTNWEEVAKALEVDKETLTKANADLTTEVEALKKASETVEKADDTIDFDGEKISKSLIPAPVLKKLEEVQKAQEVAEINKRAEQLLPNFTGTLDQRAKLLKSLGEDKELIALLVAADKLFAKNFDELGSKGEQQTMTAKESLEVMVKSYQKEKNVTYHQAYEAVSKTQAGNELILKTYKGE
jgi:hypothetical protein